MSLLLETIRIENGEIRNLECHNRRFNSSRRALFGGTGSHSNQSTEAQADLSALIHIPAELTPGVFRCRVIYGKGIEKIEFFPYQERMIRSLKMVHHDEIDYSYKYADRKLIESLFQKRGECDEILIVKKGFITDTSISNIVFQLSDCSWVTPDTPLLNGTMRMFLLETGKISEAPVKAGDLVDFSAAKMINCMMDFDTGPVIEMDRIK